MYTGRQLKFCCKEKETFLVLLDISDSTEVEEKNLKNPTLHIALGTWEEKLWFAHSRIYVFSVLCLFYVMKSKPKHKPFPTLESPEKCLKI